MLKWLIRNRLAAFERSFDYDLSYARTLLAADTRAFLTFSKVMGLSRYRRDVPVDAYYAVKLVGTLAEDCGPCAQLVVAMALREGVAPRTLSAVLGAKADEPRNRCCSVWSLPARRWLAQRLPIHCASRS